MTLLILLLFGHYILKRRKGFRVTITPDVCALVEYFNCELTGTAVIYESDG